MEFLRELDHDLFFSIHRGLNEIDWPGVGILLRFAGGLGSGLVLIPVVVTVLVVAGSRRERLIRVGAVLATVGATALVVQGLKLAFRRVRPMHLFKDLVADGGIHIPFGEIARKGSFPSGHTATAFALATLFTLWAVASDSPWKRRLVFCVCFGLAVLTGLERIYSAVHFPFDVLAGAVIGALCALGVHTWMRRRFGPASSGS